VTCLEQVTTTHTSTRAHGYVHTYTRAHTYTHAHICTQYTYTHVPLCIILFACMCSSPDAILNTSFLSRHDHSRDTHLYISNQLPVGHVTRTIITACYDRCPREPTTLPSPPQHCPYWAGISVNTYHRSSSANRAAGRPAANGRRISASVRARSPVMMMMQRG